MDGRRFVVWDGDGEPVGWFTDFEAAHHWAHMRVDEPHTARPVEVEDRRERVSRRVGRDSCELIVWTEYATLPGCAATPAARHGP